MGFLSLFSRAGKNTVNAAVNFTDGTTPTPALSTPKRSYLAVVILGTVLLGGSGWLFWENMHSYFRPKKVAVSNGASESEQIKKLKSVDTDGDGLSDYNELFAYHSSPYLFSTAGDGISDGVKVEKNENPSCPEGKSCSLINTPLPSDTNTSLSPSYLRQALIASGVSQETLANTNDENLMELYQRVVNASDTGTTNDTTPTIGDLSNLNGSSIRSLLTQNGVSADTLTKVDDATLEQIFARIIANDNSNSNQ